MKFTEAQIERYSRNLLLKAIGPSGQERICKGKVLIVGAGGLGSPAALYCAAAGVGVIGLVDGDKVELSNLQRQIIHTMGSVGSDKASSAATAIGGLNDEVRVKSHVEKLTADNAERLMAGYDFVIDCTDNFPAKFLINDVCVRLGIAFSHAGVLEFSGQTMTVLPGKSACYRCVFQRPPPQGSAPSCSQAGILGSVAGMLGTIQATEALKFLAGTNGLLADSLLVFDALTMDFRKVRVARSRECPSCGENSPVARPSAQEDKADPCPN